MRNKFSTHWKGSRKPRKQRKYLAEASLHLRRKLLSSQLSKELRKKYKKRNFPVRKGDLVKVMSGSFYGKTGKIDKVDKGRLEVGIEGIKRAKKDGTKVNVWFCPSKLMIQELNLDDKKRMDLLQVKNAP